MEKKDYWKIVGVVLLVFLVWSWLGNNDDYEYCVDNCVFSMVDCTYIYRVYDEATNDFISRGESIICLEQLKTCIEDCRN